MTLVAYFKIILLVELICATGLPSTDAVAAKCKKGPLESGPVDSVACDLTAVPDASCKVTPDKGMVACVAAADCTANTDTTYCCDWDDCNDFPAEATRNRICAYYPKISAMCGVGDEALPPTKPEAQR